MRSFPWRSFWLWLTPSALLLLGNAVWGTACYARLPDRIPRHIGPGGVDAWTDKSVGSAFVLVFVYAGVTALMAAATAALLRVAPEADRGRTQPSSPFVNRPATAASALRTARALWVLNAGLGVMFTIGDALLWRTEQSADVPWWPLPAVIAVLLAALVPTVSASVHDAREKKRLRAPAGSGSAS